MNPRVCTNKIQENSRIHQDNVFRAYSRKDSGVPQFHNQAYFNARDKNQNMSGRKDDHTFSTRASSINPSSINDARSCKASMNFRINRQVHSMIHGISEYPGNTERDYDPRELRPRRVICSEVISRSRLAIRDANLQNPTPQISNKDDDEAFFANIMKRYNDDRIKNGGKFNAPTKLPKRSQYTRKKKSFLNDDARNLMKKFREQMAEKIVRQSQSIGNGIFSTPGTKSSVYEKEDGATRTRDVSTQTSFVGYVVDDDKNTRETVGKIPLNESIPDIIERQSIRQTSSLYCGSFVEADRNALCLTPSINDIDRESLCLTPTICMSDINDHNFSPMFSPTKTVSINEYRNHSDFW